MSEERAAYDAAYDWLALAEIQIAVTELQRINRELDALCSRLTVRLAHEQATLLDHAEDRALFRVGRGSGGAE